MPCAHMEGNETRSGLFPDSLHAREVPYFGIAPRRGAAFEREQAPGRMQLDANISSKRRERITLNLVVPCAIAFRA